MQVVRRWLPRLAVLTLGLGLFGPVLVFRTSAKTLRHDGFVISMPSSATVDASAKETIVASVRVEFEAHKRILSARVSAYSGQTKLATGNELQLDPGVYYLVTTVRWRATRNGRMSGKTHTFSSVRQQLVISQASAPTSTTSPTSSVTTPTTTTPTPTTPTATTPAPAPTVTTSPAPSPVSCTPLSNEGTCYEPGEYCRTTDHGVIGVAGDGEAIECEDNNGWRWEPVG